MSVEHRFVLIGFTCPGPNGKPRLYEAGRSYPMPQPVAHAAAKHDLVAKSKPPHWTPPSPLVFEEAEAELRVLERHATETVTPVLDA
ncbi:MAG: hypothetical protein M3248_00440 [Actinomycetota bacterium]|nr:hypothetical protein [Actinomycetota bacterium]